ncbi:MAG: tetratricopeptide repeat protein [Promethearchaeota archaeon]
MDFYERGNEAVKARRLKNAIRWYKKAVKATPFHKDAWHRMAWAYFHRGYVKKAIGCLEKVVGLETSKENLAKLHRTIGTWHARLLRRERAAEWLGKSLELDPTNADVWFLLGVVQHEDGKLEGAVESWRRGLELDPRNPDAWRELGVVLEILGQFREARASYKRALKYDPEDTSLERKLRELRGVPDQRPPA